MKKRILINAVSRGKSFFRNLFFRGKQEEESEPIWGKPVWADIDSIEEDLRDGSIWMKKLKDRWPNEEEFRKAYMGDPTIFYEESEGTPDHAIDSYPYEIGPILRKHYGERICRVCGCTDSDCSGCIERTGKPCHWVKDNLCSACAPDEVKKLKTVNINL